MVNLQIGEIIKNIGDYSKIGIQFIRNSMTQGFSTMGLDSSIFVPLVFLIVSLILGFLIVKRFTTSPLASRYIGWYLLISALIFFIFNYL